MKPAWNGSGQLSTLIERVGIGQAESAPAERSKDVPPELQAVRQQAPPDSQQELDGQPDLDNLCFI